MRRFFSAVTILGFFTLSHLVLADRDPYDFVKNFELVNAEVSGTILTVTVKHRQTFADAQFDLFTSGGCLESFPVRCDGLIVRLDVPFGSKGPIIVTKTFQIDLKTKYGYDRGVIVHLTGPKDQSIRVEW